MLIEYIPSPFSESMWVGLCKFKHYGGEVMVDYSIASEQIILIRRIK